MKILAVDDETLLLGELKKAILKACPNSEITAYTTAEKAVLYAKNNVVDIAFLDIQMPDTDGIELAKIINETNPKVNIIFVTGYERYMKSAFDIYASGYLMKPVNEHKVAKELLYLRYPECRDKQVFITIKTFGNFDVFVDGEVVKFPRAAAKEILAYLVDKRGKCCSVKEIAECFFSDKLYNAELKNYICVLFSSMMTTLKSLKAEIIIDQKFNSYAIKTSAVSCDYYDFEKGCPAAINMYTGEYMSAYLWADKTNENLKVKFEKRIK